MPSFGFDSNRVMPEKEYLEEFEETSARCRCGGSFNSIDEPAAERRKKHNERFRLIDVSKKDGDKCHRSGSILRELFTNLMGAKNVLRRWPRIR